MNVKPIIPNLLTFSRLASAPFAAYFWVIGMDAAAIILVIVGALSDGLDGYLARKWSCITRIGRILDPVADKVVLASMLIGLAGRGDTYWIVFLGGCIMAREFLVSAMREDIAGKANIPVSFIAKTKTTLQLVSIVLHMVVVSFVPDYIFVMVIVWLATTFITWYSAIDYMRIWYAESSKGTP